LTSLIRKEKYKITGKYDLLPDHLQEDDPEIFITLFMQIKLFIF